MTMSALSNVKCFCHVRISIISLYTYIHCIKRHNVYVNKVKINKLQLASNRVLVKYQGKYQILAYD